MVCVDKLTTADFARNLERELAQARAELEAEKNLHGQAQAAAYEQNEIANRLDKELADLKAAGGPPFIRSEAIRNLRDQVCGLKARTEIAESNLAAAKAALAEAVEDKERLDWLSKQVDYISVGDGMGGIWSWSISADDEIGLRAAIDAARAEREGGVK